MELKMLKCHRCGESNMKNQEDKYACNSCGANYLVERAEKYADEVRKIFGEALAEQKEEQIANCRRNLWKAVNEKYTDNIKISIACRELKNLLPDDFQANFYETAASSNDERISAFLSSVDMDAQSIYLPDVARFMIKNMRSKTLIAVSDFIERAFKMTDLVAYSKFATDFEKEAEKIDDCIYDTTLPRDVFVAYSSKDMPKVKELVDYLEEEGLTCFLAARNLRHGDGAANKYDERLQEAMDNCKVLVFVSSVKSRTASDARTKELPYVRKKDIESAPAEYKNNYTKMPYIYKKPRVEYLVENYRGSAAEKFMKEFFDGLEYRYLPEQVAERVWELLDGADELIQEQIVEVQTSEPSIEEDVKYCTKCGSKTPKATKFCGECGGNDFAENYEEALRKKLEREFVEKFKKQQQEVEEQLKKQREEAERKERERIAAEKAEAERKERERLAALNAKDEEDDTSTMSSEVLNFYKKAMQGDADAQNSLGFRYGTGKGVPQDYKKAFKWYSKSAEQGNKYGQYNVGLYYDNGHAVTQDYQKAVYWYTKAADQGYVKAQYNLALLYKNGRGVVQDYYKAFALFTKAAEQKYAAAQNYVGISYENGQGVTQDYKKAVYWYTKAAEQGEKYAQNNLGSCYEFGKGVAQEYKKAVYWYTKAAEQGHANAQCNLGYCYKSGRGVAQDDQKAVYWYTKAANQGQARAQCNLGVCYEVGQGVAQDYKKAFEWYTKSAEQGQVNAQRNLGLCYEYGRYVAKNISQAIYWYKKAAAQGNQDAKDRVAKLGG